MTQADELLPCQIPEIWPKQGPSFNEWNVGLSDFARLIETVGAFWCEDTNLKYLTLWTDTREGGFLIKDREGNLIPIERVLAAMRKWNTRRAK